MKPFRDYIFLATPELTKNGYCPNSEYSENSESSKSSESSENPPFLKNAQKLKRDRCSRMSQVPFPFVSML